MLSSGRTLTDDRNLLAAEVVPATESGFSPNTAAKIAAHERIRGTAEPSTEE